MGHFDVTFLSPVLDGEEGYFDVSAAFGWNVGVNDFDCGLIVSVDEGWSFLSIS